RSSLSAPLPTDLYTLSLHDALPICPRFGDPKHLGAVLPIEGHLVARPQVLETLEDVPQREACQMPGEDRIADLPRVGRFRHMAQDRKSTRLNSSHVAISYAVFCLKK